MQREGVGKVRHLSARCLWTQKALKENLFELGAVPGVENHADLGTKVLARKQIEKCSEAVNLSLTGSFGSSFVSRRIGQRKAADAGDRIVIAKAIESHLCSMSELVRMVLS